VRAGILTLALGVGGVLAPGAGAKSETLHFFERSVTNDFFNAAGKPIQLNPPMTVLVKGDRLDDTDLDYVGDAAHHAKRWTASDHLSCTFTATAAICDAEVAVGGSLLLGTDVRVQFGPGATVVKLNGGTGVFKGAHGTAISANVGNSNNANLTLKLA
jgi:hypothetical protein